MVVECEGNYIHFVEDPSMWNIGLERLLANWRKISLDSAPTENNENFVISFTQPRFWGLPSKASVFFKRGDVERLSVETRVPMPNLISPPIEVLSEGMQIVFYLKDGGSIVLYRDANREELTISINHGGTME